MKFFETSKIRQLDKLTIEYEPITSIDLMERAGQVLFNELIQLVSVSSPIYVLAGQGNNGGDALVLARLLLKADYKVKVYLFYNTYFSEDCEKNREKLLYEFPGAVKTFNHHFQIPEITSDTIIVDGLFGTGLNRPVTGIFAEVIQWINETENFVISIDIPSGLQGENNPQMEQSAIVKADLTLCLQFPKLSYLFSENEKYVNKWQVLNIGIHGNAIDETASSFSYLEKDDIIQLLKPRSKFSHKGSFGHALIFAGSKGMAGASILSSKAAMKVGAGLVTLHGPECNRTVVQTAVPEVIFQSDKNSNFITDNNQTENYAAIAIGPGMGMKAETTEFVKNLILRTEKSIVIDADALNIIAADKELLAFIPKGSILTPHPKEFERLFGTFDSSFQRVMKAQEVAVRYQLIIILKGVYSLIAMPDGNMFFNSTGNVGMASAGTGDVLTGILVGLLAQGYTPEDASKIGVYLHGLAGDLALEKQSCESLIASDIIDNLGAAYKQTKQLLSPSTP